MRERRDWRSWKPRTASRLSEIDGISKLIEVAALEDLFPRLVDRRGQRRRAARKSRLPWTLPSFVAGILGIIVVSHYQDSLLRLIPLAALVPMLMGLAGNIGTQSSAIVTRWLAVGRLEFVQIGRIISRELAIGLGVGLLYGALTGCFVAAFFGGHPALVGEIVQFSLVTGGAIAGAMALAAVLGAAAPLVFDRSGLDPAMATGPFVTTTIDVLAVWLYLGVATLALKGAG